MRRAAAVLFIVLVAGAAGTAALVATPARTRGESFLFGDEGHNLWIAASIARGTPIYTGAYTPYGPAPAALYVAVASAASNSALSYQLLNLACSVGSMALLALALARGESAAWAAAWTAGALLPSMLAPGSLLGGLTVSSYVGLERLLISAVIWAWRPPDSRSAVRSCLIGAAAGALVFVKFGTTALVVVAVMVADLAGRPRGWRASAWVAAGTAAALAAFAGWALLMLPLPVAADVLWPSYLIDSYGWVTDRDRWPSLRPLGVVVAQYGPPIAGLALCARALSARTSSNETRVAVLALSAFAAGMLLTFQHAHHFRQYAWLLAAAGGFAALGISRWWRAVALIAVMPACVVVGRGLIEAQPPMMPVATPHAGTLFLGPEARERTEALATYAAEARARGERILVAPHAGGWHAAYGVPVEGRHVWFLGGVIRPWEYDAVVSQLEAIDAIVICPAGSVEWETLHLPAPVFSRVRPLFTARDAVGDCARFRRR